MSSVKHVPLGGRAARAEGQCACLCVCLCDAHSTGLNPLLRPATTTFTWDFTDSQAFDAQKLPVSPSVPRDSHSDRAILCPRPSSSFTCPPNSFKPESTVLGSESFPLFQDLTRPGPRFPAGCVTPVGRAASLSLFSCNSLHAVATLQPSQAGTACFPESSREPQTRPPRHSSPRPVLGAPPGTPVPSHVTLSFPGLCLPLTASPRPEDETLPLVHHPSHKRTGR